MSYMNKSPYCSGKYYKERYLINDCDSKTAYLWMANYFKIVNKIYPAVEKYKKMKVLEIGSGYGGFVDNLNKNGYKDVTASDMNDALYQKKIKNKFINLDLLNCKTNKKYDLIFAFDVMEHINETKKALESIISLLNNKGVFIFCTPYPVKKHLLDCYHTNMQMPYYYTNLFFRHNFRLENMETVSIVPYIWRFAWPCFVKGVFPNKNFISETFFVFKKT